MAHGNSLGRSTPAEVTSTKREIERGTAAMRLDGPSQSEGRGPLLPSHLAHHKGRNRQKNLHCCHTQDPESLELPESNEDINVWAHNLGYRSKLYMSNALVRICVESHQAAKTLPLDCGFGYKIVILCGVEFARPKLRLPVSNSRGHGPCKAQSQVQALLAQVLEAS